LNILFIKAYNGLIDMSSVVQLDTSTIEFGSYTLTKIIYS